MHIKAQAPGDADMVIEKGQKKGTFYISPFYEFTNFKELELTEHTNTYSLPEGTFTDEYTQEDIDDYNEAYGTEYLSSTAGIRFGYMLLDGLGINAYAGVTHYDFRSWVSEYNTMYLSSQSPALSFGVTFEYQKAVSKKLSVISILRHNYVVSSTPHVNVNFSEDVTSSNLTSHYWEFDLALSYDLGKFQPYIGGGYTQQFVHSDFTEEFLTSDNDGNEYWDISNFDGHYSGASFFGFAGLEYSLNPGASVYIRSSFINPFRANIGFKIFL
jgi:hypothetical protein